jgi:hypothetical protein
MRSPDDILAYIDQWYAWAMARPQLYASCPRCLEELFHTMEAMYEFVLLTDEERRQNRSCLSEGFYQSKGITRNNRGFVETRMDEGVTDEAVLFRELCDFWREYLNSVYRVCKPLAKD